MSDQFDKHINNKLNEKDYSFSNADWTSFKKLRSDHLSVTNLLEEKEYPFSESDWTDFKRFQKRRNRRPILWLSLFLLGVISTSIGVYIFSDQTLPKIENEGVSIKNKEHVSVGEADLQLENEANQIQEQLELIQKPLIENKDESNHSNQNKAIVLSNNTNQQIKEQIPTFKKSIAKPIFNLKEKLSRNAEYIAPEGSVNEPLENVPYKSELVANKAIHNLLDEIDLLDVRFELAGKERDIIFPEQSGSFITPLPARTFSFELASGIQLNKKVKIPYVGIRLRQEISRRMSIAISPRVGYKFTEEVQIDSLQFESFGFGVSQRQQLLTRDRAIQLQLPIRLYYEFASLEVYGGVMFTKDLASSGFRFGYDAEIDEMSKERIWLYDQYNEADSWYLSFGIVKQLNRAWTLNAGIEYALNSSSHHLFSFGLNRRF